MNVYRSSVPVFFDDNILTFNTYVNKICDYLEEFSGFSELET